MKNKYVSLFALAALLPLASHAAEASKWHTDAQINLWFAGLSGDATIKGIPADVNQSFSDVLSNLEAALAGKVIATDDRWSFATEFSYMKLGAAKNAVSVDVKQWLVEPTVGYKLSPGVEVFAGGRYNSIEVDATFAPTLAMSTILSRTIGDRVDWWAPIAGVQFNVPVSGDKVTFVGHFDLGGTGNSNFTWQIFPYLNWRFSAQCSAQMGYRWLDTEYYTGSGSSKFSYNMLVQGPQLGFTYHF